MNFKKTVELMQQLADAFRSNVQLFEEITGSSGAFYILNTVQRSFKMGPDWITKERVKKGDRRVQRVMCQRRVTFDPFRRLTFDPPSSLNQEVANFSVGEV